MSTEDGEKLAKENGLIFIETSALGGDNVRETFEAIANKILVKVKNGTINPKIEVKNFLKIFFRNSELEKSLRLMMMTIRSSRMNSTIW